MAKSQQLGLNLIIISQGFYLQKLKTKFLKLLPAIDLQVQKQAVIFKCQDHPVITHMLV
jgi:hypothetical protein